MALTPGDCIGSYIIGAQPGEGGMGAFTADPERLARFDREARTLASLNHTNIAHVYGLEHAEAGHALVMELVEDGDLSQRLLQGPIPIDDAAKK